MTASSSPQLNPNGLFRTPDSTQELMAWIERLPAHDGTRLAALTAAMMAWNLAAKLTSTEVPS